MVGQKDSMQKDHEFKFYEECCRSYHRIEDFRAKLLGFLPLVTGTGIFVSLNKISKIDLIDYFPAIGFFGFIVTLGLLFYELRGVQRCIRLSQVGSQIEEKHGVIGQFSGGSHSVFRFINEPMAAGLIYSMVLGAWTYIGLIPYNLEMISVLVFVLFFLGVRKFYLFVR